jgi:hypothetical protein
MTGPFHKWFSIAYPLVSLSLPVDVNNNLQRMHFFCIFITYFNTPTCFGPFGPSSGSYTVKRSNAKTICGFI